MVAGFEAKPLPIHFGRFALKLRRLAAIRQDGLCSARDKVSPL